MSEKKIIKKKNSVKASKCIHSKTIFKGKMAGSAISNIRELRFFCTKFWSDQNFKLPTINFTEYKMYVDKQLNI